MAASCSLTSCGEERDDDKAIIVRFSNGSVGNAESLDFSLYRHQEVDHPRKKSRRILVAESDRLSYVGQNFGTEAPRCNNLCNYYVGVLNKQTMLMEMHRAQIYHMQPVVEAEAKEAENPKDGSQTYREKVDSLIEAFGTNKQKRALSSRRLNQVAGEMLHQAVTKAANAVIDEKGLEALQDEVAQTEQQEDIALHLPPYNDDADTPENVYPLEYILTDIDFEHLAPAGAKMAALTSEELQKMRDDLGCMSVVKYLENLPSDADAKQKTACCAYYLSLLLKLAKQRTVSRKFAEQEECPRNMFIKLLRTFTVDIFAYGRLQSKVSSSMQVRLAAYCLALVLHMGGMTADLTLLHRDLGIAETRMVEIAKSMGLTLLKLPRGKAEQGTQRDNHRYASLVLPLVQYDQLRERKRRKKTH